MSHNPKIPYDDLPSLPPAADIETKAVLRRCVGASRALAELKGAAATSSRTSLSLSTLSLSRKPRQVQRSRTSSRRTTRSTKPSTSPHRSPIQTKEVLRYRAALWKGHELVKVQGLSLELIRDICSTLRDSAIDFRADGRDVRIGNKATGSVSYTPPRGGRLIPSLLGNLIDFLNTKEGPDPVIRMAIAHYQFEAIHPFDDGNGRTGRILNILYLVRSGLLHIPVLYLSGFIIRNKAEYYRHLRSVTEAGDWETLAPTTCSGDWKKPPSGRGPASMR